MSTHEEIEARLAAATPGPWRSTAFAEVWDDHPDGGVTPMVICRVTVDVGSDATQTADLIAHAPTDLRQLLDENAELVRSNRNRGGAVIVAQDRIAQLTTRAEQAERRVLELGATVERLRQSGKAAEGLRAAAYERRNEVEAEVTRLRGAIAAWADDMTTFLHFSHLETETLPNGWPDTTGQGEAS